MSTSSADNKVSVVDSTAASKGAGIIFRDPNGLLPESDPLRSSAPFAASMKGAFSSLREFALEDSRKNAAAASKKAEIAVRRAAAVAKEGDPKKTEKAKATADAAIKKAALAYRNLESLEKSVAAAAAAPINVNVFSYNPAGGPIDLTNLF